MSIELPKEARKEAIASIERYFLTELDEKIGNIAAAALLNFVLEEIGPSIYNQAVADVQERLQARVMELDIEIHEDEFQYWRKLRADAQGKVTFDDPAGARVSQSAPRRSAAGGSRRCSQRSPPSALAQSVPVVLPISRWRPPGATARPWR